MTGRAAQVQASSGSVQGSAVIRARSYEQALETICREAPIIHLEWHLEEFVDPERMTTILQGALKQKM